MRNTIIMAVMVILLGAVLAFLTMRDDDAPPELQKTEAAKPAAPESAAAKPAAGGEGTMLAAPSLSKAPNLPKKPAEAPKVQKKAVPPAEKPPTFDIVRIAKDRTAVVAGRAPPGSKISLILGGKVLAEAPVSHRGEWVAVIDKPLPAGHAELDLLATLPDGRKLASDAVVAVIVPGTMPAAAPVKTAMNVAPAAKAAPVSAAAPVAKAAQAMAKDLPKAVEKMAAAVPLEKTGPEGGEARAVVAILLPKTGDAPARLLQKPEPKSGSSTNRLSVDTVEYDIKGKLVVTGSAPKDATVRTYVDNKPVGVAQANKDKGWRLKPEEEVAPGSHTLRVDQVDREGRVVSRVELPFVRVAKAEVLSTTAARFRVIVQPGNSLWRIARRVYGSGTRFTVIYQANDDQIRDPDTIFPGQVFDLPLKN